MKILEPLPVLVALGVALSALAIYDLLVGATGSAMAYAVGTAVVAGFVLVATG